MIVLKTVDAHVSGSPLRLIVDGFPAVPGRSMAAKLAWVEEHANHLRRLVMCEPRGHAEMQGAVLTEGIEAGAHAGALFMDVDGFWPCSYEGLMAAAAIATTSGLIVTNEHGPLTFDTAIGPLRLSVSSDASPSAGARVTLTGCPCVVLRGGLDVAVGARSVRVDLAYGGECHAIVDSESAGIPLDGTRVPELRRMARSLADAIAARHRLAAPAAAHDPALRGVIFTGPAQQEGADFRAVTVTANGRVDRAPSGTGLAAMLAVLNAMGLPIGDQGITLEGPVGTRLTGRIARRLQIGDDEGVVPEIDATVWLTGEHSFMLAPADPLADGFLID